MLNGKNSPEIYKIINKEKLDVVSRPIAESHGLPNECYTSNDYTKIERKKLFEDKDDEQATKELERLEQLYTLGEVNFDSVIIIDFGDSLKSVLTSLVYSDVSQKDVLITTVNQWFDKSIFLENSIKELYYPSVNLKNFDIIIVVYD